MSTISERIKKFIDVAGIKTAKQLAEKCQIGESTLSRQLNGERSVSLDTVQSILDSYPELSAEWLMRGEGQIFKSERPEQLPEKKKPFYEIVLEGLCNESEDTLEDVRSVFNTVLKIRKKNNQK